MASRRHAGFLLCCLCVFSVEAAVPVVAPEYKIKAAFLFQFSRFVEWPATAFASSDAPLTICVLGANPFGSALEEISAGELVYTHPLIVQHHDDVEDLGSCHIVFVSSAEQAAAKRALRRLSGKSVLTVSDSNEFTRQGGVIGFVTVNGKVTLQVNRSSADAAQLRISAKLLRVASLTE